MLGGNEPVSRRKFLNGFLGTAVTTLAAAIFYPVARFISPPHVEEDIGSRVLAGKISEIEKEGWKIFPMGSDPGILIEKAPGEYRAFTAVCTHLGCTVQFDKNGRRIWCACHNGVYDLEGRNVSGPPPRPLKPYTVQLSGDDIYVSRT